MPEPTTSTGAAGIAAYKLAAAYGLPAAFAAVLVMAWTHPRTTKEWGTALAVTLISSLCGGAALIQYLGVSSWAESTNGLIGMGGLIFVCGLPGWVIVRAFFVWADKNRGKDLADLARDLRSVKDTLS